MRQAQGLGGLSRQHRGVFIDRDDSLERIPAGEVDDLLRALFRIPEIECDCPTWRKFFQYLASVGTHGDLDVEPPRGPEKIADPVRRGRDEQEQAWRWVEPVLEAWQRDGSGARPYAAGSYGPPAASALVARDGYAWAEEF